MGKITAEYPAEQVVIVYRDYYGKRYYQPLADVTEAGTLMDPETGDDLEAVGIIIEK